MQNIIMMNLKHYPPSGILKPYVKTFLVIESENGTVNQILPDTSLVLAFRLRGAITVQEKAAGKAYELPESVVTGLRASPRLITYSKQSAALLVIFKEAGASAFFRIPFHELFGLHIPLGSLIPHSVVSEVEQQLAGALNMHQRMAVVERFLRLQYRNPEPDPAVFESIQKMKTTRGRIKIKDLITELPISRDPFEKKFRRLTGSSPKQFAGIVRMRNVIENHQPGQSLTETAYSAGYFDQSHFIKDFKAFTGQTPGEFFDSPSFW